MNRQRVIPENIRFIVGIDEAGRGPLAGPVSVGAVCYPLLYKGFKKFSKGVKDSKKLPEKKREYWFKKLENEKVSGDLNFSVAFGSARMINERGIIHAINYALKKALAKLELQPKETLILLDGGLHAPKKYHFQETIIHGDDKEPIISLASIVAKVTRDHHMTELAKKHSLYGFEKHKGYGTKKHFEAIRTHGILDIHRKHYLSGL